MQFLLLFLTFISQTYGNGEESNTEFYSMTSKWTKSLGESPIIYKLEGVINNRSLIVSFDGGFKGLDVYTGTEFLFEVEVDNLICCKLLEDCFHL
jgi:hypothetical protein